MTYFPQTTNRWGSSIQYDAELNTKLHDALKSLHDLSEYLYSMGEDPNVGIIDTQQMISNMLVENIGWLPVIY